MILMPQCTNCKRKKAEYHYVNPESRTELNEQFQIYHRIEECTYPDELIKYCEDCLKLMLIAEDLQS